jgi:hypothetical protein
LMSRDGSNWTRGNFSGYTDLPGLIGTGFGLNRFFAVGATGLIIRSNAIAELAMLVKEGRPFLQLKAEPGSYTLQSSKDLLEWSTLDRITNTSTLTRNIDTEGPGSTRFYRVIK